MQKSEVERLNTMHLERAYSENDKRGKEIVRARQIGKRKKKKKRVESNTR